MKNLLRNIFKDKVLVGNFLFTILFTISNPLYQSTLFKEMGYKFLPYTTIVNQIFGILYSKLALKYEEKMFKLYKKISMIEVFTFSIITCTTLFDLIPLKWFYVLDTILYSLVTILLATVGNIVKSRLYPTPEERSKFDNTRSIVYNVASLIGSILVILVPMSVKTCLIITCIALIIDDFFYCNAYTNLIKKGNNENE